MTRRRPTQPRNSNGQFISKTQKLLEQLNIKLGEATGRRAVIYQQYQALLDQQAAKLTAQTNSLVPDLSVTTVANLKVKCPGFVTAAISTKAGETRSIRVPLWPWICRESAQYKRDFVATRLKSVRASLTTWLGNNDVVGDEADTSGLADSIKKLQEEDAQLSGVETALKSQINGLMDVCKTYSRPDAPAVPKGLDEAVSKSSTGLANAPIAGSDSSSSSGMDIYDYLILDSILNDRHRYDRNSGDYHHSDGTVYDSPAPTSTPWGGSPRDDDAPSGRASTSFGESTPSEGGRATVSFGDSDRVPSGRSTVSFGGASRDDRTESGSGTGY